MSSEMHAIMPAASVTDCSLIANSVLTAPQRLDRDTITTGEPRTIGLHRIRLKRSWAAA